MRTTQQRPCLPIDKSGSAVAGGMLPSLLAMQKADRLNLYETGTGAGGAMTSILLECCGSVKIADKQVSAASGGGCLFSFPLL